MIHPYDYFDISSDRIAEFWSKVNIRSIAECWEWPTKRKTDYGMFMVGTKTVGTHRVAWQIMNGKIPQGLLIRHSCDNPPCCNPLHLLLGTHKDNYDDWVSRGKKCYQK